MVMLIIMMVMMMMMMIMMMMQVIDCYPRPTEPESCEALNTLDCTDKNSQASFLPNYLAG